VSLTDLSTLPGEHGERNKKTWTVTSRSMGSLLIMSINGGLLRGVPVVSKSPSMGLPNTLTASQRLVKRKKKLINIKIETSSLQHK
jgi:hypothetical protein